MEPTVLILGLAVLIMALPLAATLALIPMLIWRVYRLEEGVAKIDAALADHFARDPEYQEEKTL